MSRIENNLTTREVGLAKNMRKDSNISEITLDLTEDRVKIPPLVDFL